MANCAIVGINWGDEGKGRMVDLIAEDYGVVVRYQGGNNAGHTVVNEYGKFALHLLPSGIFRKGVVNVLGNGTVVDPEKLLEERIACKWRLCPCLHLSRRIDIHNSWCRLFHKRSEGKLHISAAERHFFGRCCRRILRHCLRHNQPDGCQHKTQYT